MKNVLALRLAPRRFEIGERRATGTFGRRSTPAPGTDRTLELAVCGGRARFKGKGGEKMRLLLGIAALEIALCGPVLAAKIRGAETRGAMAGTTADNAVEGTVRARLGNDRLLRGATVVVAYRNGVVTLAGAVPSDAAHIESLDVARTTPGVAAVQDDLRIVIASPDAPAPP